MSRWLLILALLVTGLLPSQGCVVYTTPEHTVYSPVLSRPIIDCRYDPAYAQYYWYFEVQAADGDGDVMYVGVDVYDRYTGQYLETQDMFYVGGDEWNVQVYEQYSPFLECPVAGSFDFVFWAQDAYGNYVEVGAQGPQNNTPSYTGPALSYPYVECGWDPTWGDYYWYAEVAIQDPNGLSDITEASLWIYLAGGQQPVEGWQLFYDSAAQIWYSTFWQSESYYLDCRYPANFGYQFTATDRSGQMGYVNAPSVSVY